jgi:phosphatidylglycerophosphatase A
VIAGAPPAAGPSSSAPVAAAVRIAVPIATLFGAGRSPIVPGTAGTLAAMPLALACAAWMPLWGFAAATLAVAALGIWAADVAAPHLGGKDPGPVVIDEAAGLMVTLLGIPVGWASAAGAFFLFRVMDVIKPPPARQAERLPGGWGIMTDDLIAGVYANLALRAILHIMTHFGVAT